MKPVAEPGAAFRIVAAEMPWHVQMFETVAGATRIWDMLDAAAGGSAYQSRRFLEPWIEHVAPARGVLPRIGVAFDRRGTPVALLPFGIVKRGPLRATTFLGGRDANLNMPLVDPAAAMTAEDADDLLRTYAAALTPAVDLLVLSSQPRMWRGRANPFATTGRPSPSNAFGADLGASVETFLAAHDSRSTRKKLRAKATHLAELGAVTFERVHADRASTVIEAFVEQKGSRLHRRGIDAELDAAHVRLFLTALTKGEIPALDLYVLRVGEAIAALFGGLPHGDHWHGLINSFDDRPAIARCSPGELLMRQTLSDLGRRGFRSFDLGIGEARYKNALCDEVIELADRLVPLTAAGRAFAYAEGLRLSAKGAIKRRPWALNAVRRAQATIRSV